MDRDEPVRRLRPKLWEWDYLPLRYLSIHVRDTLSSDPAGVAVDVGAGRSPYRPLIHAERYVGIDIAARAGEGLVRGDAHALPVRSCSADLVVSFQAFEHFDDPDEVVREIKRIAKPGARLVISTHGNWPHHGHDFHRWTYEGLALLFRDFRHVRVVPMGGPLSLCAQLLERLLSWLELVGPRPIRPISRVVVGGVTSAANMSAVALESLLGRSEAYRRERMRMADVYLVTCLAPDGPARERD